MEYTLYLHVFRFSEDFGSPRSLASNPKMKILSVFAASLAVIPELCFAESNQSTPLPSHQILPKNFKPSQVFKNTNLVRNVNLEKGYVRETINVVIENIDGKPQDEYYIPFKASDIGKVGGFEVRDKKDAEKPAYVGEIVEYDPYRYIEGFCQIAYFIC